jgi:hypothetical protein
VTIIPTLQTSHINSGGCPAGTSSIILVTSTAHQGGGDGHFADARGNLPATGEANAGKFVHGKTS